MVKRDLVIGKMKTPIINHKLTELVTGHCSAIIKKRDSLIIERLNELGYNTTDVKAIAQRCTQITGPPRRYYDLYIDIEDNPVFVCRYTNPEFNRFGLTELSNQMISFEFGPMPPTF